MSKMSKFLLILVAFFLICNPFVSAKASSVQEWNMSYPYSLHVALDNGQHPSEIMSKEDGYYIFLAEGYVLGIKDAENGRLFCVSDEILNGQIFAVVSKYLDDHPNEWNYSSHILIEYALFNAFPCKSSNKSSDQ